MSSLQGFHHMAARVLGQGGRDPGMQKSRVHPLMLEIDE